MARLFNGTSSDLIELPAFEFLAADSSVTVAFWNRVTTAQVQQSQAFTIGLEGAPNNCNAIAPWEDSNLYWDYGNFVSGEGRISTSYAAFLDKWTHVAVLFNAATDLHAIYLDGVVAASHTHATSPQISLSNGRIGRSPGGTQHHHGAIAEFTLWSVALTAVQIKALASGSGPFYVAPASLVGYWPLLGDSPEPDYSKNRNSGTLAGTTVVAHPPVMPGLIQPSIAFEDRETADVLGAPIGVFDPQLVPKGWF